MVREQTGPRLPLLSQQWEPTVAQMLLFVGCHIWKADLMK
jgi:hypothetical protein